jgi:hypothetical protein
VSALLLKRLGFNVFGVYMHNWDASDEVGSCAPTCTSAADLEDAKQVSSKCEHACVYTVCGRHVDSWGAVGDVGLCAPLALQRLAWRMPSRWTFLQQRCI